MTPLIDDLLAPSLIGEDPSYTEGLWERLYQRTIHAGQRGILMRALSTLDIALWDIKGKELGAPVCRLLGGCRDRVPVLVVAGYYEEGKGPEQLAREMRRYAERDFTLLKFVAGALGPEEDAARIRAVREAVGPRARLMLDIDWGWRQVKDALAAVKLWEPYRLELVEEPFPRATGLAAFTAERHARRPANSGPGHRV
jgi:L-alanine-DL-glutamate epimerase-like enolase superfamily enzyme